MQNRQWKHRESIQNDIRNDWLEIQPEGLGEFGTGKIKLKASEKGLLTNTEIESIEQRATEGHFAFASVEVQ